MNRNVPKAQKLVVSRLVLFVLFFLQGVGTAAAAARVFTHTTNYYWPAAAAIHNKSELTTR